ncbi:MAG: glycosyltransferase family 2 protein [Thermodesulfobacteriota bacterium]|nr:glycosyltransferase family 2 protein [Thermodesulfobacteriota bacterium]
MNKVRSVSLVIPVYNEEENLPVLFEEVKSAVEPLGIEWEVFFIDDGSRDKSLVAIKALAEKDEHVRYISFAQNQGQSAGFCAGFEAAQGEVIITLDADLQNDPADIPAMLEKYQSEGADMVIGRRVKRMDSWIKRIGSKVGNGVRNWLTKETVRDTGCSLKIMRAYLAKKIPFFTGMHRFLPTLMKLLGGTVVEMDVNHRPRRHGKSKYGTLDRALAGSYDLLAVRWMQKRFIRYKIKEKN